MKYFIANWKANKNIQEATQWIDNFMKFLLPSDNEKKIIICPPFPLIYPIKQKLGNSTDILLGVQDISSFEEGKYTGEVTAKTLRGLVNYSIIGHSERRKYFKEEDIVLESKVINAKKYGIETIYCIRNEMDAIPKDVQIIAYEPQQSIGTGNNEEISKVIEMKNKLNLKSSIPFLYGGSVNKDNVLTYLQSHQIDGFLISTSSLDPKDFYDILNLRY